MTFTELDRLVGGLPGSARTHPAWWANSRSSQPQARFWLDAKRRATPDLNAGRVRFVVGAEVASSRRPAMLGSREAGLTTTDEMVSAAVQMVWLSAGTVELDGLGKLTFAHLPVRPGVYRFTLTGEDSGRVSVYIGESDNLARRMGNYRNPGPTQLTNLRMHARMDEVLIAGGTVNVAVAIEVAVDGQIVDLTARPARQLAGTLPSFALPSTVSPSKTFDVAKTIAAERSYSGAERPGTPDRRGDVESIAARLQSWPRR